MFPKIGGFPPKSSILKGFSIMFTIHFWGFSSYFWKLTYPQKWHFEDDFPFPKVGYVNPLEGRLDFGCPRCVYYAKLDR